MSDKENQKVTIDVAGIERALRRMIAAKEIIDAAIESVADLLVEARPQGLQPANKTETPATFGGRKAPIENASEVPGWQQGLSEEKG